MQTAQKARSLVCSDSVTPPPAAADGAASGAQLSLTPATTTIKTAADPLIQCLQPWTPVLNMKTPFVFVLLKNGRLIMQASYVTLLAPRCPRSARVGNNLMA